MRTPYKKPAFSIRTHPATVGRQRRASNCHGDKGIWIPVYVLQSNSYFIMQEDQVLLLTAPSKEEARAACRSAPWFWRRNMRRKLSQKLVTPKMTPADMLDYRIMVEETIRDAYNN